MPLKRRRLVTNGTRRLTKTPAFGPDTMGYRAFEADLSGRVALVTGANYYAGPAHKIAGGAAPHTDGTPIQLRDAMRVRT
jgi:hypothetical protein